MTPDPLDLDAIEARANAAIAKFNNLPGTLEDHGIHSVNTWIAGTLRDLRQTTADIPALVKRVRDLEAELAKERTRAATQGGHARIVESLTSCADPNERADITV